MQRSISDRIRWQYQCHLSISFWTTQQQNLLGYQLNFFRVFPLAPFYADEYVVVTDRWLIDAYVLYPYTRTVELTPQIKTITHYHPKVHGPGVES